jgi:hypothetical protein
MAAQLKQRLSSNTRQATLNEVYVLSLSCKASARIYEGRPESKDRLVIKKNKQNRNKEMYHYRP